MTWCTFPAGEQGCPATPKPLRARGCPVQCSTIAAGLLKWETANTPQGARTVNSMHSTPELSRDISVPRMVWTFLVFQIYSTEGIPSIIHWQICCMTRKLCCRFQGQAGVQPICDSSDRAVLLWRKEPL